MASGVANPDLVSALCVECGLCCSGAIFDQAQHQAGEEALARALGMELIATPEGELAIRLPCPRLADTRCTAYGGERPAICGAYFCQLAQRLDRDEIGQGEALEIVREARALLAGIAQFSDENETHVDLRQRWERNFKAGEPLKDGSRFHFLMGALSRLLDRHFRRPGDTRLDFQPAERPD